MDHTAPHRVILIDTVERSREVVVRRLTAQGYAVDTFADPALGAELTLASPPCAVVADLWMQLCRLLRPEPATTNVLMVLADKVTIRAVEFGRNAARPVM